ncbi:hypothetical protein GCM10020216_025990 [Nonomuraea helvata]
MGAEVALSWSPSVEISNPVREGWQRQEPADRERRRHLTLQQQEKGRREAAVSGGEWRLTERDQPGGY